MKTEAEVREAIKHVQDAIEGLRENGDPRGVAAMGTILDLFQWVMGATDTKFEAMVVEPCRAVDRMFKASQN